MIRISIIILGSVMLATNAVAQLTDNPRTDGDHTTLACKEELDCAGAKWPDPKIEACTAALAGSCSFPKGTIFFHRAHAYYDKREYDLALADFGEAIRLMGLESFDQKPRALAEAFSYRSRIYFMRREYDSALANIDEAIRLHPANSSYYGWRATLYVRGKRDYDRALADLDVIYYRYTQDRSLGFNSSGALILRGEVYALYKRDYDRGIADLDEALRHSRDSTAHTLRGLAYLAKGEAERAHADFDAAEKIDPQQKKATQQRWQLFNELKTP